MSDAPTNIQPTPTWRTRWQIPVFALSLLVFGGGIARLAVSHRSFTFGEQCAKLDQLEAAGAYTRANAYVHYLLKAPDRSDEQRGELF